MLQSIAKRIFVVAKSACRMQRSCNGMGLGRILMRNSNFKSYASTLALSVAVLLSAPAMAQDATADDADQSQEEIVVTAVAKGQNKLESSISVSSLSQESIANAAPRSVAELFRNLPGIRSESSGGEGNANISVRGLPVASGGSKFLQLQEDGLPVLEFGDIAFGNADIFLRSDFNVQRVESVRGGSSSTFASNAPGGVINLISKTGEKEGGAIQATVGLDYGEYRLDADYGGRLSDTIRFHVGGFYRQGEGPRRAGYDGNKGYQVKGNITKEFENGFIRLNFKRLDDRAIAYLPSPVRVTGTNSDPKFSNLPGLDANNDTIHSAFFTRTLSLDKNNNPRTTDVRDGQRPLVNSFGIDAQFEIEEGLTLTEKFKYADVSGRFVSPFPAGIDTAQNIANGIGGAGSTLTYANGPRSGQPYAGTNLLIPVVLFNTEVNSLNNFANDIRLTKEFDTGSGKINATLGFYKSSQALNTTWTWNSYLLEPNGNNAALVNVANAAGVSQTDNGLVAYGASFFGNCCRRAYDVDYDINAPFGSVSYVDDRLTVDASVRYDSFGARGFVTADGPVVSRDVNGDGVISVPETKVTVLQLANPQPVNYDTNYWSYSAGANFRLSDGLAIFGRYSRGGRANADRILLNPNNISTTSGRLLNKDVAIDFVKQAELGVKYRSGGLQLYGTLFRATTEEENFEATTQRVFSRAYKATGLEVEGSFRTGPFSLSASGTYTDAKISRDNISPANKGKRPRRQAKFVYQITPQFEMDQFTLGANVIGTTSSYAQDSNELKLPAFTQVNAFLSFRPTEQLQLSLNANNLFDVNGFTESEEGSIPANGIIRARSINGRTISASIKLGF
jgi:outer membrane receptor protein involved in Fe transport